MVAASSVHRISPRKAAIFIEPNEHQRRRLPCNINSTDSTAPAARLQTNVHLTLGTMVHPRHTLIRTAFLVPALGLVLAIADIAPARAHGDHRECEDSSSGRHRHAPTGERIPCGADTLQTPANARDVRSSPPDREAVSNDPGRDAVAPGAAGSAGPQGSTARRTAAPRDAQQAPARDGTWSPADGRRRH